MVDTYAVLDDGSERTMLLPAAAQKLGLGGSPEILALRTIRQDVQTLHGASVSFKVSPLSQPQKTFHISRAFTAKCLGLADQSYPLASLQRRYKHLEGLPLQPFDRVRPLLLIGTDNPHLITPIERVRLGPPGGPAAIKSRLGWTLQGPVKVVEQHLQPTQCLLTTAGGPLSVELMKNVEKLRQVDIMPYRSEKLVTQSREDQEAIKLLEAKAARVEVNGVHRYATSLLRRKDTPTFQAIKEAVMPSLRSTERKDPERAHRKEISKLDVAGSAVKIPAEAVSQTKESWYIPHHLRRPPDTYEWQVLPFGTTCSPCCATFALQRHVIDHSQPGEDVRSSVEQSFYVNNCLQSLPSAGEAKRLVDKMRELLASGGYEVRQWSSNVPGVVNHLPEEARSDNIELWLSQDQADMQESTLGLSWHCPSNTLGYKHRSESHGVPTMRNVYRVLARQYDPLGFIIPFTM
ncbi:hypothetical protein SKAU_G00062030 [Synaphobranchus kaupii]|uniref:Peptidase A2 domain-containing protein n=1 Tax=Synaphobranchus kaupii TaxID=118154 RepID=A0A9Q1G502_SYNKA|nr:hypothetical protein SKAU_G00062030 [Synaphobranchus kaupii]